MLYLPDTNVISAYMRVGDPGLAGKMQSHFADLRLSVVVLAERKFGVVKGGSARMRKQLGALTEVLPSVPFTIEDAEL